MNDRDRRRYDRATRVQTFGRDNAAHFAAGSKATTPFTSLDGLIVKTDAAKADQSPNRVSKETRLDSRLRIGWGEGGRRPDEVFNPRTARDIEKTENGFAAPYRIPDNPSESAITTDTDSVLGKLEDKPADSAAVKTAKATLRARFVAYELPADFVTHLRADRDAITDANKRNQSEVQDGVGNTKLIDELLGQINDVIGGLDAIMFNKYARVPEKLRAWQSPSHVERAAQREKKPTPAPTPPQQ